MNKIRVIDLLNKIANGEDVPKEIKYDTMNYYFRNYDYKELHGDLIDEQTSFIEKIDFYKLNDEVEIIEEKKIPEKLEYYDDSIAWVIDDVGQLSDVDKVIIDKLNDVIDYLKVLKK